MYLKNLIILHTYIHAYTYLYTYTYTYVKYIKLHYVLSGYMNKKKNIPACINTRAYMNIYMPNLMLVYS
jgi:hypothetical protein